MNKTVIYGWGIGIIFGLILMLIILKFANNDSAYKTKYDERQQVIRLRGYMYAFWTILVYEVLLMALAIGKVELPAESYIVHFIGIILGCIVLAGHSIWKGVYWGLNNNKKRYIGVFIALFFFNLIPIIGAYHEGSLVVDGKLSTPCVNIIVEIMILIIAILLIVKEAVDRKEGEGEE